MMHEVDLVNLLTIVRVVDYMILFFLFNTAASIHYGLRKWFYYAVSTSFFLLAITSTSTLFNYANFEVTRYILTPLITAAAILGLLATFHHHPKRNAHA